jgi:hypothetical protein
MTSKANSFELEKAIPISAKATRSSAGQKGNFSDLENLLSRRLILVSENFLSQRLLLDLEIFLSRRLISVSENF